MAIDMPLITVDITAVVGLPERWRYAVLLDKPFDELCAIARANPTVYIFPFYTGAVDEVADCSPLFGTSDPDLQHIFQPFYVGNLHPVDEAIRQILDAYMIKDAKLIEL